MYIKNFKVNQSDFDKKITIMADSAIINALKDFTDSIKHENFCAESIMVNVKNKIMIVWIPRKNLI